MREARSGDSEPAWLTARRAVAARGGRSAADGVQLGAVVEVVVCAIDRSPEGENPLADVGLEVRSVLTRAQLDAVQG